MKPTIKQAWDDYRRDAGATRPRLLIEASGWALDEHRLAHQVKRRGPVVHEAWCGRSIYGAIVDEITDSTRRCGACPREKARAEAPVEHQGRLF